MLPPAKPGWIERLRANTPKIITDNAPRIVGALKITGSYMMTRSENKVFAAAGWGFVSANTVFLLFGGKKTEEQKAKLREEVKGSPEGGRVVEHIKKVFQPHKYTYESGATIAALSSTLWTAAGFTGGGRPSIGRFIAGLTSLGSDANAAFTKEKIGQAEANPHRKGSIKYHLTELKNRPILVSSSLNVVSDLASVIGGAIEYFGQKREASNLLAGSFLLVANIFQALFVNKNDYNLEPTEAKGEEAVASEEAVVKLVKAEPAHEALPQRLNSARSFTIPSTMHLTDQSRIAQLSPLVAAAGGIAV